MRARSLYLTQKKDARVDQMRMLMISTSWEAGSGAPKASGVGDTRAGPGAGTDSSLVCPQCCSPPQRLAGKRQQEHLAFGMTQPVLVLQGRHIDTRLQLWTHDGILFPLTKLPAALWQLIPTLTHLSSVALAAQPLL